ncbi:MAG: serine/threonine protein phosphatase [Paenibacillus sp.]|nr:serine/threonine protein phosphatase [Paenibacillus sp.]
MLRAADKQLCFTFAVIADSHINPEQGDNPSPYQTNRLANERNRHVVERINALSPDFVIHLGDFVQPVHTYDSHAPAMANAHAIYSRLNAPLYALPGNHDIGDKPLAWMPGPKVEQRGLDTFESFWGATYRSFDYKDSHFVLLNTSIMNSGMPIEQAQWDWLEQDLAANRGKRIFVFTHYPLYVFDANEEEHYDNLGEPARSWLLALLKDYRAEAVYSGHVHHFFYNRSGRTELVVLPSVTFQRPDYAELFEAAPEPAFEGGRNDPAKLGFMLVNVYADGHVNHLIRTNGQTARNEAEFPGVARHALELRHNPLGVYWRQAWGEPRLLPYGNVDEFDRKIARNDYPLLATGEMGVRSIRIPLTDLGRPETRKRMDELSEAGFAFTVFTYGVPEGKELRLLIGAADCLDVWELILPPGNWLNALPDVLAVKRSIRKPVRLSVMESSAGQSQAVGRFHHFVRHGFGVRDVESLAAAAHHPQVRQALDGFVFRLGPEDAPVDVVRALGQFARAANAAVSLHVQMQGPGGPAAVSADDRQIASRLAAAAAAAMADGRVELFFDTFTDHDRGYSVRHGIVDRRSNPRLAARVLAHLTTAMAGVRLGSGEIENAITVQAEAKGAELLWIARAQAKLLLVLPTADPAQTADEEPHAWELPEALRMQDGRAPTDGEGTAVLLSSGRSVRFQWRADHEGRSLALTAAAGSFAQGEPVLYMFV